MEGIQVTLTLLGAIRNGLGCPVFPMIFQGKDTLGVGVTRADDRAGFSLTHI